MLFDTLLRMPDNVIYCLINDQNKKVYLTHSKKTLTSINRIIESIKNRSNKSLYLDRNKLELRIIERIDDLECRLVRLQYWIDYYKELGYTLYNNPKSLVYKVRTNILLWGSSVLSLVELVNRKNESKVVGVFDSMDDSNRFIDKYYKGKYLIPIYSTNKLTYEWYNTDMKFRILIKE